MDGNKMNKFKLGDVVYLKESGSNYSKVRIIKVSSSMYTVKFENGGGIRVRENRLFKSIDDLNLKQNKH